jgi:succinate dehydrogenase flavin-adding protein (antitoxin of CptAB toxin-antitoxin module)
LLEEIEQLVDNKINLEIDKISELSNKINNIKDANSNEYQKIYSEIKNDLNNYCLNQKKLDDKSYKVCTQIINDIFNFYISGYPDIPDKYLYSENAN